MNRSFTHHLLIVGIASAMYFTVLGQTNLWDEDEAFFATAAAEMHRHNDWIVPTFNEGLFAHKPPFMYWMMRIGFLVFGVGELGARFGSAVFGVAAAVVVYHLGRILFSRTAGFWGALCFATCLMWGVVARASTADSYLVFFINSALLVYVNDVFGSGLIRRSLLTPNRDASPVDTVLLRWLPTRWSTFVAIYVLMGLAVLVKGPIGILLPGVTISLFVLAQMPVSVNEGRLATLFAWLRPFVTSPLFKTFWRMRPFTAIATVIAVAGPWFVAVGWRTDGAFLREFFGVHNFGRFVTPMENHRGPIIYYLPVMLIGLFPWTIFTLPTILQALTGLRDEERRPRFLFLMCWAIWMVAFFSIARTKLPNYVLPAYPAVALLIGYWIDAWVRRSETTWNRWPSMAFGSLVAVGAVLLVGLTVAGRWNRDGISLLERLGVNGAIAPDLASLAWLGVLPLCGGVVAWWLAAAGRREGAGIVTAIAGVGFTTSVLIIGAIVMNKHQTSAPICKAIRERAAGRPIELGSYRNSPPSVIFYAGRRVERLSDAASASEFLCAAPNRYLITTDAGLKQLGDAASERLVVIVEKPRFPRTGSVFGVTIDTRPAAVRTAQGEASDAR
jgi:4-amino-4-deoxy-L-arabinose transferase-like glycosyltransferase